MKKISWQALRSAEIKAAKANRHIRRTIKCDNGSLEIVRKSEIKGLVKKRPVNSHKGTFGKLLLIVGSDRYPGAAQLSTIAALRSGVGLASCLTTYNCALAAAVSAKEATFIPCPSDDEGFLLGDDKSISVLKASLASCTAVLIGCGIGKSDSTLRILKAVIENADCPIIIDADGINLVSSCIELLRKARTKVVLTPHVAELSRMAGVDIQTAIEQRYEIAKRISAETGAVVVSKSCATVIVSDDSECVCMYGNDGLSKGGSGDMLAGLIASFCAQGIDVYSASKLGTTVLGVCCERVSRSLSKTGMTASDILNYLPKLFKKIERA